MLETRQHRAQLFSLWYIVAIHGCGPVSRYRPVVVGANDRPRIPCVEEEERQARTFPRYSPQSFSGVEQALHRFGQPHSLLTFPSFSSGFASSSLSLTLSP
jgi:hypothetical protein